MTSKTHGRMFWSTHFHFTLTLMRRFKLGPKTRWALQNTTRGSSVNVQVRWNHRHCGSWVGLSNGVTNFQSSNRNWDTVIACWRFFSGRGSMKRTQIEDPKLFGWSVWTLFQVCQGMFRGRCCVLSDGWIVCTVKYGKSDATCPSKCFFCSERTNTTFDKPILWINMPVNEVVLKGFSLHFLRGCLQTVGTTMYRHAGERGYRPGAREYDHRARDVNG